MVLLVTRPSKVLGHWRIGRPTEREEHSTEDHRDEARNGEIARLTRERVAAEADDDHEQRETQQDTADHGEWHVSARGKRIPAGQRVRDFPAVKKVRAIPAPRQENTRIVVLGVVLWPDRITLHAVVESDAEEVASENQEGDQATMFQITDDLGNAYDGPGGGGGSGDAELHVNEWQVDSRPGVAADATRLTVTIWVRHSVYRTVEIPL